MGKAKSCSGSEEELWQCPGTVSPWQRKIKENTPGAPPAPAGKAAGWKGRAAPQDAAPRGTQGDFGSSREKDVHEAQAGPEEILTNKYKHWETRKGDSWTRMQVTDQARATLVWQKAARLLGEESKQSTKEKKPQSEVLRS